MYPGLRQRRNSCICTCSPRAVRSYGPKKSAIKGLSTVFARIGSREYRGFVNFQLDLLNLLNASARMEVCRARAGENP